MKKITKNPKETKAVAALFAEKLKKFRPGSLDEARQIDGIRASDLTLLFLRLQG